MKGVTRLGHTACRKWKRVRVQMIDGEVFVDKFMDRNPKYVFFEKRGKVIRGFIKQFTIIKGYSD